MKMNTIILAEITDPFYDDDDAMEGMACVISPRELGDPRDYDEYSPTYVMRIMHGLKANAFNRPLEIGEVRALHKTMGSLLRQYDEWISQQANEGG